MTLVVPDARITAGRRSSAANSPGNKRRTASLVTPPPKAVRIAVSVGRCYFSKIQAVTQIPGPAAANPLFAPLVVPPVGTNRGMEMNREAITRLQLARKNGMPRDDVADLYEYLKLQIEDAADNWRAKRATCEDGSIAFIGEGHVLVVHETGVYTGKLGGLLKIGGTLTPNGFRFPRPDLNADARCVA